MRIPARLTPNIRKRVVAVIATNVGDSGTLVRVRLSVLLVCELAWPEVVDLIVRLVVMGSPAEAVRGYLGRLDVTVVPSRSKHIEFEGSLFGHLGCRVIRHSRLMR